MKTTTLLNPAKTKKNKSKIKTIAVAGNPNVGKSTVFNALTGLRQHTGNWPGKTVEKAEGKYTFHKKEFKLVDIPGTYSLLANSPEEEIARNFICFEKPDAVVIVMDATCIERNLNLALQILEITSNVIICLNLIDEAKKKNIFIDEDELSLQLGGVPVVCTNARKGEGLENLMEEIENVSEKKIKTVIVKNKYSPEIEACIESIEKRIKNQKNLNKRWLAIRFLEENKEFSSALSSHLGKQNFFKIQKAVTKEKRKLNFTENLRDNTVEVLINRAESIYKSCVKISKKDYDKRDRMIDKFLTSPLTGFPTMILFLMGIFWITITGANYPSEVISSFLFSLEDKLMDLMVASAAPAWLSGILISGIYRTLSWVVSVMLPPMAIFFPLFTLLEDVGYLPRIAFNLDKIFKKCGSHGKQSLTMCMGFGCNACGVTGCRIIDSPRERLIAVLTNNFVPCNGRFPLLISVITMFFIGQSLSFFDSFKSTLILTSVIIFGVVISFIMSKILSKTLLKGLGSSFILELPPYRKPQIGKILIRSLFDRTIFILGRAVAVAAPAGLIIWVIANVKIGNLSLLMHCANFLDPFARMLGLDGVILMAFILGFPANEIVFPIIIMSYMCTETILEIQNPAELHNLLISHGWTYITGICVMLFSLLHFPCGTTLWTIKKETKSLKWTALSFIIPTVTGILVCFIVSNVLKLFPV